jgi:hypothetical protein
MYIYTHVHTHIHTCMQDDSVHGVVVQQPFPGHIREECIVGAISPSKDAEGMATQLNESKLATSRCVCVCVCMYEHMYVTYVGVLSLHVHIYKQHAHVQGPPDTGLYAYICPYNKYTYTHDQWPPRAWPRS